MAQSMRVEGIREARARIDRVGDRARRPEPALRAEATRRDLMESERRTFARNGPGWRRDTRAWINEKRRRGLDSRTMRATGQLQHALESGQGMTFRAFNGTLTWGIPRGRSSLYYAQALAKNRGGKRGRRVVRIDKPAVQSISERVQHYIAEGQIQ